MSANEARHDAWSAGESYEAYMGRWSRQVAPRFLDWLAMSDGLDWLETGCGTGALSATILDRCDPASLLGVEQSEGFVALAQERSEDARAVFEVGDVLDLDLGDGTRDVTVSALLLNFLPDPRKALSEKRRVTRPGGTVAFYVWDYPGGGVEFMAAFWRAATALDPEAAELDESQRFPDCTPEKLARLAQDSGLASVEWTALEVPTLFQDFDDLWLPFTLGTGPAPGYCASLDPARRDRLRDRLASELPRDSEGCIPLQARAWGVKGLVV